jgi:hypothetical protein
MAIRVSGLTAININAVAKEVSPDHPGLVTETGSSFVVFSASVDDALSKVQASMDRVGEIKGRRGGNYGALVGVRNKLLEARDATPVKGAYTEFVKTVSNGATHEPPAVLAGLPVVPAGTGAAESLPAPRRGRAAKGTQSAPPAAGTGQAQEAVSVAPAASQPVPEAADVTVESGAPVPDAPARARRVKGPKLTKAHAAAFIDLARSANTETARRFWRAKADALTE